MGRKYSFIHKPELPTLSSNPKEYHVVSSFLAHRANKLNTARLACQLKNIGDSSLAEKALRAIFKMSPRSEEAVWGNSFPQNMGDLGNGNNCFFFKPESLEREINWSILGLKPYSNKLKDYVLLRDQIERNILLGNYHEAKIMLEQSLNKFGYSVWYYEMRLIIAGVQCDIEEGIALITKVNETYKEGNAHGIVPILLQNLYNRSFTETPLRYDNMVASTFKRNRDNSNRYDYYLFRLNYYQYADLDNLSEVVEMEHIQSVIDRYSILLYVLRSCFINQDKKRSAVLRYAKQLYNLTNDLQLLPLLAQDEIEKMPNAYYDSAFISILDCYYTGDYNTCINLCREYLDHDPSNLYVIKLYCRSLMFLRNGFQPVTQDNESLLHKITFNTFKVMVEKDNGTYIENLNTLLKKIYGLRIAAQLDQYIRAEQREPHTDRLALFSIIQFDPIYIRAFEKESQQISYLEQGFKHMPNSVAIQYRKQCIEKTISSDSPVVDYIRDVDTAKITYEHGDYETALNQWGKVFEENHHSIPTCQTAVEYIFRSYVALGTEYRQDAVNFYVNCYMENRSYVSKVATEQFMNDLKQSRYEGLRTGLDLMIFVFLNADKYPQKQFVLQRYCGYERVTYPSELIPKFKSREMDKVELFLSILLNDDILYHHYKLRSTMEVLDEKLKIVNFLMSFFPENKTYSAIYTELMHELVAYRGMNKLDDSKIFVNEDAVMKYELCDIGPLYERFCKQATLARKGRTVLFVGGIDLKDPAGLSELIQDSVLYSDDAVADVAAELFFTIRRAFLKSRFGLSTYLSTRIRHGVFEGEMRSFLQRLDLILSTDSGNYIAETHWHHQYHIDSAARDILNNALRYFSLETDNLIASFKDNVIQIRVDKNDTNGGLFCYDQPIDVISNKLMDLQSDSSDARDFCHRVMEWLWEITSHCLEAIRDRVQNELRPRYTSNLDYLERCVERINTHDKLKEDLLIAINNAREELNTRIVKVERWFYRQQAKMEDFKLSDHAKMAFDTTGKYSTDVDIDMDVSIPKLEPLFKAEYSASMFDLLLIFFSNMFKYSFDEFKRPAAFTVSLEDEEIMHMHLENKLRAGIDEDEQNKQFQHLINEEGMIQKENGSGLAKAMNIVKYDFGNPDNTYTIVARGGKCIVDIYIHLTNMII